MTPLNASLVYTAVGMVFVLSMFASDKPIRIVAGGVAAAAMFGCAVFSAAVALQH